MTSNTASHAEAGDDIAAPVRVGDVVVDKYLIERTLGVGGMGVVVAARDQVLDRRVAIKFLLPKLAGSDTSVQRFVREARAATRITSEHVARLLEIEKLPSGAPFFVMEYLEGSDLRALLRERGALAPSLAVDYVLQAVQAVAEGHVKGIVHRDIKPGNLFLTKRADGTPLIKVLDFGIAKTLESDAAESTSLTGSDDVRLGSPAYMPPEQLQNPRDVDERSDIWSLGATLYELLCGRPPFEGPGYLELASRILSQPPNPISKQKLPSALPAGLEQILLTCLEKDRARRYANAAELAAALAPFGSDDARMSLSRVNGVLASQSSIPALTRAIPHDAVTGTATLDVPTAPSPQAADERRTSNIGAVASTPALAAKRSRLIFAVAAAGLILTAVIARRAPSAAGVQASARPSRSLEPAAAAAVATKLPSATPITVALEAAMPTSTATVRDSAGTLAHARASSTASVRRGAREQVIEPVADRVLSPSAAPPLSAKPASPAEQAEASEPQVASAPGRSAEIERLIEQRR